MIKNIIKLLGVIILLILPGSLVLGKVIVSEISWMGTVASSFDEWIELANVGNEDVNLSSGSGWTLSFGGNLIKLSGIIKKGETFLLERTDQTTLPGFIGQLYTGALSNTGDNMILMDEFGEIQDSLSYLLAWCAGSNTTKSTMERISLDTDCSAWRTFFGQGTSLDVNGNIILGSPGFMSQALQNIFNLNNTEINSGTGSDILSGSGGLNSGTGSTTGSGSDLSGSGSLNSGTGNILDSGSGSLETGTGTILTGSGAYTGSGLDLGGGFGGGSSSGYILPLVIQKGDILINEVNPQGVIDFAELYSTKDNLDISKCMLTDLDGEDSILSALKFTLNKGDYVVIYWQKGITENDLVLDINQNRIREIYLEDTSLSSTDDQLVLICDEEIVDAVVWTNNDGEIANSEKSDTDYLISNFEWVGSGNQQDAVVIPSNSFQTIGRNSLIDTDSKYDFEIFEKDTLGKENVHPFYDHKIVINEIYANPPSYDTGREWIELRNLEENEVDLSGWMIKDSSNAYVFPSFFSSKIKARDHIVIFSIDSGISLSNSEAEIISLIRPDGVIQDEVTLPSGEKKETESFARRENLKFDFTTIITPGEINMFLDELRASSNMPSPSFEERDAFNKRSCDKLFLNSWNIIISEVYSNPKGDESSQEFIELMNIGKSDIPLVCFSLEDFSGSKKIYPLPNKWLYPSLPQAFYKEDTNITLNNGEEKVFLKFSLDDEIIDLWEGVSSKDGFSFSKIFTQTGSLYANKFFEGLPTPNQISYYTDLSNIKVRINEILVAPENFKNFTEFIEIYNFGDESYNLQDLFLEDKAGGRLSLLENIIYPQEFIVFDDLPFALNDSGETIYLKSSFDEILDIVEIPKMSKDESFSFDTGSGSFLKTSKITKGEENIIEQTISTSSIKESINIKETSSGSVYQNTSRLSFSEIYINPEGSDKNNEWIELEVTQTGSLIGWEININGVRKKLDKISKEVNKNIMIVPISSIRNSGGEIYLVLNDKIIESFIYKNALEGVSYIKIDNIWNMTSNVTKLSENIFTEVLDVDSNSNKKLKNSSKDGYLIFGKSFDVPSFFEGGGMFNLGLFDDVRKFGNNTIFYNILIILGIIFVIIYFILKPRV